MKGHPMIGVVSVLLAAKSRDATGAGNNFMTCATEPFMSEVRPPPSDDDEYTSDLTECQLRRSVSEIHPIKEKLPLLPKSWSVPFPGMDPRESLKRSHGTSLHLFDDQQPYCSISVDDEDAKQDLH